MNKILLSAFLFMTFAISASADPAKSNWPEWRGPTRDARIYSGAAWPSSLSSLSKRWRVELSPGYSGPIVWGDRVFVTETENSEKEIVRALDRKSGTELWRASWSGALSVPFFAKANGDWIRSTPACDGESLFVGGMRDVLVSLDVATGAERWRFDFPERLGAAVPAFGFVSSPLVAGEFVFVQAGGAFVKLNKKTGELIWRSAEAGGGMNSAFSSPVFATLGGVDQLLVQMREELMGLHPDDGRILWRQTVPSYRGMNILTPTVYGDGIITSTHKNRTFFYRVANQDGVFAVNEAWNNAAQGYMSSPVIIGDYVYLHLGNGRLCCIDLRSGKETWRSKSFGKYWSMAVQENRILALDERGELLLIEAAPDEFRLLDRKEVSDNECWAHVAVSNSEIFVRDLGGVSLFDWPSSNVKLTE
jgi:outer membrane protein assembly factor BamB